MTRLSDAQVSQSFERAEVAEVPDAPTAVEIGGIPLAIHGNGPLGAGFQHLIGSRMTSILKGLGPRVERAIVRFEDLNGPKGGIDTACRIQLVLSREPALVVEARAEGEAHAFRLALPRLAAALKRRVERRGPRSGRASVRLMAVKSA